MPGVPARSRGARRPLSRSPEARLDDARPFREFGFGARIDISPSFESSDSELEGPRVCHRPNSGARDRGHLLGRHGSEG